jgi:hypothetical protein
MALSLRCCAWAVNALAHSAAARAIAAYRRDFEKAWDIVSLLVNFN